MQNGINLEISPKAGTVAAENDGIHILRRRIYDLSENAKTLADVYINGEATSEEYISVLLEYMQHLSTEISYLNGTWREDI